MRLQIYGKHGFRLRSIIVHSVWISIIGILLFRLGTANTQNIMYIEIFSISGVILATSPWIIQVLVSTTIILLYRAKCYDLTWLVRLSSEEGSCCQGGLKAVDEGSGNQVWVANGNEKEVNGYSHGGTTDGDGLGLQMVIEGRNGPRLQRSRTV